MPPLFLVAALVLAPLIVGVCLAYAGFKSYRKRRFPIQDIEQAHPTQSIHRDQQRQQRQQQQIELRALKYSGLPHSQRPGQSHSTCQCSGIAGTIVPSNVAPVAIPLEIESIGGEGVVSYPRPSRVVEEQECGITEGTRNINYIQPVQSQDKIYPENKEKAPAQTPSYQGNTTPGLISSTPRRMITHASTQQHVFSSPYDDKDTKAAEIWQRIERQNLPTLQVMKIQEQDERIEPDNPFVIDSSTDEKWFDEELEEQPIHQKSVGRSLLSSSTPVDMAAQDDRSSGRDFSTENDGLDFEYGNFVNPSDLTAAGAISRGAGRTEAVVSKTLADMKDDTSEHILQESNSFPSGHHKPPQSNNSNLDKHNDPNIQEHSDDEAHNAYENDAYNSTPQITIPYSQSPSPTTNSPLFLNTSHTKIPAPSLPPLIKTLKASPL
ncbi:hypothetical protein T440DRAFT_518276 [Plenodomus tracheiphilus IPT5]|uniref:Uncharacterized protein n=1 Tax=Plenodomus tracheiphilus IPT5 TaxID=1408161 RepID=A0A6A7B5H2_9PLEO|nr:hypothetical protein T440DRAFT_518276 [Plenodomus tracheiphilus IPT5]